MTHYLSQIPFQPEDDLLYQDLCEIAWCFSPSSLCELAHNDLGNDLLSDHLKVWKSNKPEEKLKEKLMTFCSVHWITGSERILLEKAVAPY